MSCWQNIPILVKRYLVGYLDYEARCNLKLCSKSDQFLVTSTRHVAQIISIAEQSNSSCNELSTIILRYEFRVLQLEEIDGVTTMTSGEYQKINNKNRYDVARSWIEKISENGVANAKKVQLLNLSMPPSPQWILNCEESLKIRMVGRQNLKSWLQITVPILKILEIEEWEIAEEILETRQIRQVGEVLRLSRNVKISDEQLVKLAAPSLVIISGNTITEQGAKKVLKKFVEQNRSGNPFELKFRKSEPNFNHLDLFDKSWTIQKLQQIDETEGEYVYQITGGFTNVHRVQQLPKIIIRDFVTYMTLKVLHPAGIYFQNSIW
ncbi:DUF38 domain-containing protein [Caenorhabditis elegans]|uniref:DUF38 domain-containing protein n=1 Tax=Caenorhabditis elegans TaxID=6239 RepID=Q4W5R2_CAEEL|nr:DUF38 domain-containing protein [Caenorhabditis elegans]CCD67992.1 DUF38 domain-containing protein [Caenorhabditis elegans]|eukprot:NP_490900.3 Uncharacterized protein CELE_Y71G12B.2 [Caenorhabditis elegans]